MKIPQKTLERKLFKDGYDFVVGIDEVGMGCLAGPVTVCAVAFTPEFYGRTDPRLIGLRDSKLLSARQRENYSHILKNMRIEHKVISISSKIIDKINIYQAARMAMRQAVRKLTMDYRLWTRASDIKSHKLSSLSPRQQLPRAIVLVDGNTKIAGLPHDQQAIVKGDQKIFAIACASIIAKVHRDRLMRRYAKKHPGYGFEIHKGYGTKLHRQKIKELGVTAIHRRSFKLT